MINDFSELAKDPRMLSKILTKQVLGKFEEQMSLKHDHKKHEHTKNECLEKPVKHKEEKHKEEKHKEKDKLEDLKYLKELKHLKELKKLVKEKKEHSLCGFIKKYEGKDVSVRTQSGDCIMGIIKEVSNQTGIVKILQPSTYSPYEPEVKTVIRCQDIESITIDK
ncbi:hypothetical protein [Litchfieldia salsa]|uniref:Uncharacterized protein n=1 Tax=Litchfieldia salsa TaxID=930152 RepID=A0A1H0ST68_9BACI|nr:hypothetical protein [Litchfieldia salsa]SDP44923.1 hypothetical protein SAMN05216565_103105 [Litchfieldia salsa]